MNRPFSFVLAILALLVMAQSIRALEDEEAQPDRVQPERDPFFVYYTLPLPNTDVAGYHAVLKARVSQPVAPEDLTPETFRVRGTLAGNATGTYTISGDSLMLLFDPLAGFAAGELIEAVIARALHSAAGEPLSDPTVWHYRTRSFPGTGGFLQPEPLNGGSGAVALAAGHLNGDRKVDLVSANLSGRMAVFINTTPDGDNEPLSYQRHMYDVGVGLSAVLLADFDNDGHLDIAVADQFGNLIHIARNLGDGLTYDWSTVATCDHPQRLAGGDLNGDGFIDLAFPCQWDNTLYLLLGDGTGGFSEPGTYLLPLYPSDIGMRDLDLDGDLDLVLMNRYYNPRIVILRNQDAGAPLDEMFIVSCSVPIDSPQGVLVEDFDGDRLPDVVATTEDSARVAFCKMLPNNCIVEPPVYYPTGGGPADRLRNAAALDYDADGDQDIAVTNSDANIWLLMANDGDGAFDVRLELPTSERPILPLSADLNRDGRMDLAIPARITGKIDLYLGIPQPAGVPDGQPEIALSPAPFAVQPNPFRGRVELALPSVGATGGRLDILDVSGRRVRSFLIAPGRGIPILWDGTDQAGREVPSGSYTLRLVAEGGSRSTRLIRVR